MCIKSWRDALVPLAGNKRGPSLIWGVLHGHLMRHSEIGVDHRLVARTSSGVPSAIFLP